MFKIIRVLLAFSFCAESKLVFPKNFQFGVASSAYQTEGAWNSFGKGESMFDDVLHRNKSILPGNADTTCKFYDKFREDVQLLRDLGVDIFRFSLSWTRILPTGHADQINPDGIWFYNELINELLRYNITPFVTIHHWDLPAKFGQMGGWNNPAMIDYFRDFADIVFQSFGDRVKMWTSLNEPAMMCSSFIADAFYNMTDYDSATSIYSCGHNALRAHAKVYHLLKTKYKKQKGKLGIVLNADFYIPLSDSIKDHEAANRVFELEFNWLAHPIFSAKGDYSHFVKTYLGAMSQAENYAQSKLPEFTSDEIAEIQGAADFLGLNHYQTMRCTEGSFSLEDKPSREKDMNVDLSTNPEWEMSDIKWGTYPDGFYQMIMFISKMYGKIPVVITENGFADYQMEDARRERYLQGYLESLSQAIKDGANVVGYVVWSLMDSFEWWSGYKVKLGLFNVDFTSPDLQRTPKKSVTWYKEVIRNHKNSGNTLRHWFTGSITTLTFYVSLVTYISRFHFSMQS